MKAGLQLLECAKEGKTERVRDLLRKGASLFTKNSVIIRMNSNKWTPNIYPQIIPMYFSQAIRRFIWPHKIIIMKHAKRCLKPAIVRV